MKQSTIKILSSNAREMRELRSIIQSEFKDENVAASFSRNRLIKLLDHARKKISETKLDSLMSSMEEEGYVFLRRGKTKRSPYALSLKNVYDIADKVGVSIHSSKGFKAFVSIMMNLKGGVGKSLATNMTATGCIMIDEFLLKGLRILIVDLDPQGTTTESNIPGLVITDIDVTSIQAMADNLTREELLESAVKVTSIPNLSIIPCGINDGFILEELVQDEIRGEYKAFELLKKRIIEPLENDYDFIFLDCGPHMDIVMKNALAAANGVFIPVPPTFYNFDSTLRFLEKLDDTIDLMVQDGFDLTNLNFIKGFVTKDLSHLNPNNSKHNNMLVSTLDEDMCDVFGPDGVLSYPLRQEDAYERCVELGGTIFTLIKSRYSGSPEAFNRAYTQAESWAKEVIRIMLRAQKEMNREQ